MSTYTKTTWVDRNVQYPNRYTITTIDGDTEEFTAEPGTITQAGTQVTAANMNNIEDGVETLYDEVYTKISETTLAIATAQVDISISGFDKYRLYIDYVIPDASNAISLRARCNSDSGNNYNYVYNYGISGASVANTSAMLLTSAFLSSSGSNNRTGSVILELNNKQANYKTFSWFWTIDNGIAHQGSGGGTWDNSANLLTTLNLYLSAQNINTGARFVLYGLTVQGGK